MKTRRSQQGRFWLEPCPVDAQRERVPASDRSSPGQLKTFPDVCWNPFPGQAGIPR